ncbi:MAG: bifunctional metallophosphatase/5'-nucleotidase [Pseudomonadales bacterium]|nr:bifunctional metallophosphatase/5'-nucleotidase [Pseudomonadales bacterium]
MTNSIANFATVFFKVFLQVHIEGLRPRCEYRRGVGLLMLLPLVFIGNLAIADDHASSTNNLPITIFHTNDLQSRLLGFGPNADYSPGVINNDLTIGGVARLATLLEERRSQLSNEVVSLTLDGGDIMMGTLFHTVSREKGTEFQLLKQLDYDGITLGNHDFDFRPDGLAAALMAAKQESGLPPIVLSNIIYSSESSVDDGLEALAESGFIKPSLMVHKNNLKIGLIGVLGWHAISVIGEVDPLEFADPIASVQAQVSALKAQGADLLILLSHSGIYRKNDEWLGDDIKIAKAVPELDLIISGHAHIVTPEPVTIGKTLIVQAGSDGRFLGELSLEWDRIAQQLINKGYQVHRINDAIVGNSYITQILKHSQNLVNEKVLAPYDLLFDENIIQVDRHLSRQYEDHVLGNVASDSLRLAASADIAVTTNGEIRDEVFPGKTGMQQVSDIFRIFPIGIGYQDDSPGYDLVKVYFTAQEIKSLMEILLIAYQMKGPSFYPRISGINVSYNPYRLPLDRVTEIRLVDSDASPSFDLDDSHLLDLSGDNKQLYSVAMTHYAFKFLSIIDELSYGLLSAKPKDEHGNPVTSVADVLVDSDPNESGTQRQKAWSALLTHLKGMPDLDGDGVANLKASSHSYSRIIAQPSFSPNQLLKNSNGISLWVYGIFTLLILGLSIILIHTRRSKNRQV